MKIVIVRHADPNYAIDSLTDTGWQEAEILSDRISRMDVKAFYVSPLGRAQDTASITLKKMGREAETLSWLQEFPARMTKDWENSPSVIWDWIPEAWMNEPNFYDPQRWMHVPVFEQAGVPALAQEVANGLDALLAKHGYVRDGMWYRAEQANEDTIVLFCHFGLECLLLWHLLNISPMILWHGLCAAPTSVSTIYTEERREGIANFRMAAFGDISHLYAAGREPSFSARFCETFANKEQLH